MMEFKKLFYDNCAFVTFADDGRRKVAFQGDLFKTYVHLLEVTAQLRDKLIMEVQNSSFSSEVKDQFERNVNGLEFEHCLMTNSDNKKDHFDDGINDLNFDQNFLKTLERNMSK